MIENLTNQVRIEKTIRSGLLPIGSTGEHFINDHLLENDKQRAENYKKVKGYIDRYHKTFIESVLSKTVFDGSDLEKYYSVYMINNKTDADKKELSKIEGDLRKYIVKQFEKDLRYKTMFKKEMILELLPPFLEDEEEKKITESFFKFTTYFDNFFINRKNMYTSDEKSTGIAYRCINENLPKFVDNINSFRKVVSALPKEDLENLNMDFSGLYGLRVEEVFTLDYFSFVLAQSGIDKYNNIIGGYSNSDSTKIKGLNEYINGYNQKLPEEDKAKRLPLMMPLYKQILSDKESISFIPEAYKDDNQLLQTVYASYNSSDNNNNLKTSIDELGKLFECISDYDSKGIYVSAGLPITDLSNNVFGDWSIICSNWNKEYEANHKMGKNAEKFYEKENNEYKKIKSFSINELQTYGGENENICTYYKNKVAELINEIKSKYSDCESLLATEYSDKKRLAKCDDKVELIKLFLDSVKNLEKLIKPLLGTGKEEVKDNAFYGKFLPLFDKIKTVDELYNSVRNYLTQKPYKTEKIKLNFDNPQFLNGWDKNKERDYKCVLMRKDGLYYLAIMNKANNKLFENLPVCNDDACYEKVEYKQISSVSKYFSIKQIKPQNPPQNILRYLDKNFDKKSMTKEQLTELIKYIAEDFIPNYSMLHDENGNCYFDFKFKDYSEYNSWQEFCESIQPQAYSVSFKNVSASYTDSLVENGSLYLFQIYNKDFSEKSKGKPNLHTLYFKMLFDEKNLNNVVYKLNGGAEMFYREHSIEKGERVVHDKNVPIKRRSDGKEESLFPYDIVKDKRYTVDRFLLHLPITLNFKADDRANINAKVIEELKKSNNQYVIGIDRGERNLVYASVVDMNGNIVEQKSFNLVPAGNRNVDYHYLLDKREKERDEARKSWKSIGNIKELKEGYISQVVHQICKLVIKYDAVIALEDLNMKFFDKRKKIEKQVYQKFENMLITKLNYLVDKDIDADENGGLLHAYQLTNKLDKYNSKSRQNGIVLYVPAWLTSKIDPATGFVNLIKPKCGTQAENIEFVKKIDDIKYNEQDDLFEFYFDYSKFPKCNSDYRKKWVVCTNGERIRTFRNKDKNDNWDCETVLLMPEFKKLFNQYNIDYRSDLKSQILAQTDSSFFRELMKLLSLTMQLRNSKSGNKDEDYIISPVRNSACEFYDSRNYSESDNLPCDADANGAYNIARKVIWSIEQIKNNDDIAKFPYIHNNEWLEYVQKQ